MNDACALAGLSATTLRAWAARGCCIAIDQAQGDMALPRWQFQPRVLKALPLLTAALGVHDGRELLHYLETPAAELGGATPRRLIEQGDVDRVLSVAARHAS